MSQLFRYNICKTPSVKFKKSFLSGLQNMIMKTYTGTSVLRSPNLPWCVVLRQNVPPRLKSWLNWVPRSWLLSARNYRFLRSSLIVLDRRILLSSISETWTERTDWQILCRRMGPLPRRAGLLLLHAPEKWRWHCVSVKLPDWALNYCSYLHFTQTMPNWNFFNVEISNRLIKSQF